MGGALSASVSAPASGLCLRPLQVAIHLDVLALLRYWFSALRRRSAEDRHREDRHCGTSSRSAGIVLPET